MNREVEERIVAMYFDNEDFEKNAKTTIDTLGQLKKGLDLEDSAKGFETFEKIGKTLNFSQAQQGLTKVKNGLFTVKNKMKDAFSIGEKPIKEAEGFLKKLNGYITKYVGFDVASKIVHGFENTIRKLTVQPLLDGFKQYESTMDSVKTIMSSTGESMDVVKKHLADMTNYANQTIYSLTDMTSNLGKFTNNGVDLERSVKAMEGIANATADAGQGAQQASMAMYNVSQAIGVGKMTSIDWKSLENANIATQKLKSTFLEMAAIQGKIEKKTESDGSISYFLTKDENGKALKESIQLTTANFREYLSKGWLDKETMLRAFEVYSGTIDENTLEAWGIHDEESKKYFMNLGKEALEAATQVRTFTKMIDALKESAQSGWAKSFEFIFGDMEQGTTLWTRISKEIDDVLTKSSEARNNILAIWAGKDTNTEKEEKEIEEKKKSIEELQKRYDELVKSSTAEGLDGLITGNASKIAELQRQIQELRASSDPDKNEKIKYKQDQVNKLKKDQQELEKKKQTLAQAEARRDKRNAEIDSYKTQIEQYKEEIKQLEEAGGKDENGEENQYLKAKRQKQAADKAEKMNQLQKKLDKLLKEEASDDELSKVKREIEQYEREIENIEKLIGDKKRLPETEIRDSEGRSGRQILIDALLGREGEDGAIIEDGLVQLMKEIGSAISSAFGEVFGVIDAQGLFDFTQRIADKIHAIVEWFGKANDETSRLYKLKQILKGILGPIKLVFNIVKSVFGVIKKIAAPILDIIIGLFAGMSGFFEKLGNMNLGEAITAIGDGLKVAWEKIKKWFTPQDIFDDQGKWVGKEAPVVTWLKNIWGNLKKTVKNWAEENGLGGAWTTITGWWATIKEALETGRKKLSEAWTTFSNWLDTSGVKGFFSSVYETIVGAFTSKRTLAYGYRQGRLESWWEYEDSPVVAFFKNLWNGVKEAFDAAKKWWDDDSLGIRKWISDLWNDISGLFTSQTVTITGKQGNTWTEERGSPIAVFFTNFWEGIENAFNAVKEWWNNDSLGIRKWLSDLWTDISGLFKSGTETVTDENGNQTTVTTDSPIVAFFKNFWKGIEDAFKEVVDWWNNDELGIRKWLSDLWEDVSGLFRSETVTITGKQGNSWTETRNSPIVAFFVNFWEGIESAFNSVKEWWKNDSLGIRTWLSKLWSDISGLFKSGTETVTDESGNQTTVTTDSPIVAFFKNFWKGIEDAFKMVSDWWEKDELGIRTWIQNLWNDVAGIFKSETVTVTGKQGNSWTIQQDSPIVAFFKNFWEGIENAFNSVVEWWNNDSLGIRAWVSKLWNDITGLFQPKQKLAYGYRKGKLESWYETEDSPIVAFFKNLWHGVENAYNGLKAWWKRSGVGDFFTGLWNDVSKWFTEEKPGSGKTGFDEFLTELATLGSEAWAQLEKIPWDDIGAFFQRIWNWIIGLFTDEGEGLDEAATEADKVNSGRVSGRLIAAAQLPGQIVQTISDSGTGNKKATDKDAKNTEEKLSIFQVIIGTLTEFFNSIAETAKQLYKDSALKQFFESLGNFLKMLVKLVTKVLDFFTRIGNNLGNGTVDLEEIVAGLIGIIFLVFSFISYKNNNALSKIKTSSQSIGLQFLEIAIGFMLIASAVSLLTTLDEHKMLVAAAVLVAVGGVITAIIGTMGSLSTAKASTSVAVQPWERVVNNFVDTLGKIAIVFIGLKLLPDIIRTVGDVKKELGDVKIGEDVMEALIGLVGFISGIAISFAVADKMTNSKGIDPMGALKTIVSVLLVVGIIVAALGAGGWLIGLIGNAVGGENWYEGIVDRINEFSLILAAIFGAIGQAIYAMALGGTDMQKSLSAKEAADQLYAMSQVFDIEKVSGVMRMVTLAKQISDTGKGLNTKHIEGVGKAMGELGEFIYTMAGYMAEQDGYLFELHNPDSQAYQNLIAFVDIVKKVGESFSSFDPALYSYNNGFDGFFTLAQSLHEFAHMSLTYSEDGPTALKVFIDDMKYIIETLGAELPTGEGIDFDGVTIVGKLFQAIQDALLDPKIPAFDATSIVDAILFALGLGDTAIAACVHDMVQKGIYLATSDEPGGAGELGLGGVDLTQLGGTLGFITSLGSGGLTGGIDLTNLIPTGEVESQVFGVEKVVKQAEERLSNGMEIQDFFTFTDKNGNPEDPLAEMQAVTGELQKVLDESSDSSPLTVKVTPVFDFENLKEENFRAELANQNISLPVLFSDGSLQISFEGLAEELGMANIAQKLEMLSANSAVQIATTRALGTHIDLIANEVSRLKLYLDTGALVGGIIDDVDAELYNRSVSSGRTGVSTTITEGLFFPR